jgi:molybdopterin synthase catalytic subunit
MRPRHDDTWLGLVKESLPLTAVSEWAVRPHCGALVVFTGMVRDHAGDRDGVSSLEYEAYTEQVEPRLAAVAADARSHWPDLGRLAMLHRVGLLGVEEAAVVVAISAPHRHDAFAAARFCIDTLKETVPIWKKETWGGGQSWVDTPARAGGAS